MAEGTQGGPNNLLVPGSDGTAPVRGNVVTASRVRVPALLPDNLDVGYAIGVCGVVWRCSFAVCLPRPRDRMPLLLA